MISVKKLASAVGGKTARACDSCIKKRARWYCAADDAFLCQACDSSVHSANLLAGRHERVRLKTASSEQSSDQPSWHHGFKRKPRTPRIYNKSHGQRNPIHLVPEMGRDENLFEENDEQEQLLYRVPVFDSFAAQLWVSGNSNEGKTRTENEDVKYLSGTVHYDGNLQGFHQSKKDVEELTADIESLLGKGLDGEYFDMETLGFLDCRDKDLLESSRSTGTELKQEESDDGEAVMGNAEIDITGETFELNFNDYNSPGYYDEDNKARVNGATSVNLENQDSGMGSDDNSNENKKNILLALDYEGVITAWADQKSPWITGGRPEVDPTDCWSDCWSDCMDVCEGNEYQRYGEMCGNNASARILEGGREARLSRYKEKRQNRLFSKKIRYEVRKLNAEKRPRMKGRFVKRESSAVNSSTNISFIDSTIVISLS